jgi:hypothetical protein
MKRPVILQLSLAESEAIASMLAQHQKLWRVVAKECGVEMTTELEERITEAHRAGVQINATT